MRFISCNGCGGYIKQKNNESPGQPAAETGEKSTKTTLYFVIMV